MNFTSGEWMALITAFSALVVVVGGVVVNIIVSLRKTVDATADTVKKTAEKVSEVALKVDGAATASTAEIKSLQEMMTILRGQIADQKQTAAVLAQTAPLVTSKELNGPVVDNLKNIDANTAETARNTAKTEAAAPNVKPK